MWNTYGMSEINPITSTSCEKMTGTRVHHVEHSKKSRDPSFEQLRIYHRNSPIKKHIPNTLVGVFFLKWESCVARNQPIHTYTKLNSLSIASVLINQYWMKKNTRVSLTLVHIYNQALSCVVSCQLHRVEYVVHLYICTQ